ncbi:lamin-like protein isoform X4 [Juglans microcarpa x Juglans regia]|uniref:lamin-like protein isoform X4 n=1 Tax=Juglans microcarpa x Juglans regia TaxID=2249226 RepID=UPI001B7E22DF|nr:lamin-like protein isoform X4 [Juglans microcarpa x Juglans regia]
MEEEMKKKRNKKKKRKQSKATEDVAVDAGETASLDQNHESNGQDDNGQVSETADAHNDVQNINVDPNGHLRNGTDGFILIEAEKQKWLQRVVKASLEETVKVLQKENQSHIKKEATLEEAIKQLQQKNHSYLQKEASLEETFKVLQNENEWHIKKEATLEETVKQLQQKNHYYVQKEATLEETINQLQHQCHSYIQKEASFEGKISQLLEEKANLGLKGESLEEKVKHLEREKCFWILKENSTKETLANLHGDAAKLQAQVVELEEFRSNLLQENQRLMDIIPGLQSQIQNLERSTSSTSSSVDLKMHGSEHEDLNSQMEAALALVEKLMTENAELVEKVNELYVELDRRITTDGLPSVTGSIQMFETTETASVDPISESNEDLSLAGKKLESVKIVPMKIENIGSDNVDVEHAAVIPISLVSEETGEIVQISMDDNEIRDKELQAANNDEKTAVPLSDAPLVGAPFRLISFVTRYVSGADLVNKNSSH